MSLTYQVSQAEAEYQNCYLQEQISDQAQQQKPYCNNSNQENFIFLPEDSFFQCCQPNIQNNQINESMNYDNSCVLNLNNQRDPSYISFQQNFPYNQNNCENELNNYIGACFEPNSYCKNQYYASYQENAENFISIQQYNFPFGAQESENEYNNQLNQLNQCDQKLLSDEQRQATITMPIQSNEQVKESSGNMENHQPKQNTIEELIQSSSRCAQAKQQRKQKKLEKLKKIQQQISNLPKRDLRSHFKQLEQIDLKEKNFLNEHHKQINEGLQQSNFEYHQNKEQNKATKTSFQNCQQQQQQQEQLQPFNQINLLDEQNALQNELSFCNQQLENQIEDNQLNADNDQYLNSSTQQAQTDLDGSNKDQFESNFMNFEAELAKNDLNYKVNKKNVVKNIMSSFQRFIYSAFADITSNQNKIKKEYLFQKTKFHVYFNQQQEDQVIQLTEKIQNEVIQIYNNDFNNLPKNENKEEFIHKFKRYFTNRQFNNCTIKHLIKHKSFSKIFQYYLQFFFRNWLINVNIQNIESHILISDLFLKSFHDKQLLINLTNRQK
ncbi:hypothetical protein TTHERM_00094010 (macronuclear) [Tetrahymena thermophila SB210]|uniref:Uncharacterized protein n=1 Tax=Tetrahymena thermophila (strain SB210) TaxID=312017 RepID=Q235Z0_TETTS|nr:hypothetical protein TTHERM_00094010 [Tetrahymena thermophila SB210]EAR92610.2 hypothetical protein TTHERM_00094010 [Tetrahymena thermophila SB210]|eukprot:XP_001012855.2 hypothetical protein TTHERM_00094010 [Tetrahymena thermophila SB210]